MSGATADTVRVRLCMCAATKMLVSGLQTTVGCILLKHEQHSLRFQMIVHSGDADWKQASINTL